MAFGVLLLGSPAALAEPHLGTREGLRCSRCHTSPTGGGKRTPYGALYAQTHLSIWSARPRSRIPVARGGEGDGWVITSMTTGEVTSWLALGADLRVANSTTFANDEPKNSFEATQGTVYLELRPWPDRVVLYVDEELAASGARNREAWAMVIGPPFSKGKGWSTYLRGGWFLPPYGLRILDDDNYVRRSTGANFSNSDLGLELGLEAGPVFAALAVTNGKFANKDTDVLKAFYGLVELDLRRGKLGLSGLYNPSEDGCRAMFGAFGAVHLGRLVLSLETDLIAQRPADDNRWFYQLTTMAQMDLLITKGLNLHAGYDFHDGDVELRQDRRQRFRFGVDLFPLRMVEAKLYYVHKQSETGQPLESADQLEVMLHVYL